MEEVIVERASGGRMIGQTFNALREAQKEAALGRKVLYFTPNGAFQIMQDGSKVPYEVERKPPIIIIDEADDIMLAPGSEEIYQKIIGKNKDEFTTQYQGYWPRKEDE